ncbi:hypothetical protein YC2023_016734 [Brassica napus]
MKVRLSTELVIISLVTRLPIPSFLESHITEEIEVRKEIPKPKAAASFTYLPVWNLTVTFAFQLHGSLCNKIGCRLNRARDNNLSIIHQKS